MRLSHLFQRTTKFLKEVYLELRRVTWPTRREIIKYTLIVIGFSLVLAVFLGGLDFLFNWLLNTFVF